MCNIEINVNNSTESAFALLEQQATDIIDPLKIIFLSQGFLSSIVKNRYILPTGQGYALPIVRNWAKRIPYWSRISLLLVPL